MGLLQLLIAAIGTTVGMALMSPKRDPYGEPMDHALHEKEQ
jgi:hypothetical protein